MADSKSGRFANHLNSLREKLRSFRREEREMALKEVIAEIDNGNLKPESSRPWSNLHAHTFFSYSCEDYSPSRLVLEAYLAGLSVIGSTDFDVLDSLEEMFSAGDSLGIRTTVSIETRAFVTPYADREINSPGEPGINYSLGVGFWRNPESGSPSATFLTTLALRSRQRNLGLIEKINPFLSPVALDYEADVIPLTPAGNATERHICAALDQKSRSIFPGKDALAVFWSDVLGRSPQDVEGLLSSPGAFRNAIRGKLMKKGGVGYVQPDGGSFPSQTDFFAMIRDAGAIPCLAWLDGSSLGETDPNRLLGDFLDLGIMAVNIIPERNWNLADPKKKEERLDALARFIQTARQLDLPILAGTEMNSPGQKLVDLFDTPELAPYREDFQQAAYWLYGHTCLARTSGMGVGSDWTQEHFATDRRKINAFYREVGSRAEPGATGIERRKRLHSGLVPAEVLDLL
ncbi:MAG: hypothetical protein LBU79_10180 [Planctomycetota bacterium]|jgi:hypothetical protein|nr:hypothetical protein [Planctomycetota bacterium]